MATYSSTADDPHVSERFRTPVQRVATLAAGGFLLVGVAGLVPGITTHYGELGWSGPDSHAMLVGLFMVSVLHDVVHLAYGVVGVVLARRAGSARAFLFVGGVVYAVLWVYGLVVARGSPADVVPLNTADDWLHLVLAGAMIGLGAVVPGRVRRRGRRPGGPAPGGPGG